MERDDRLCRPDHPRRVDRHINYFGDSSASSKPVKNDGRYREAYASCMRSRGDTGRRLERERISYGEERPLCIEHNEACWSQNRRAQFLVKSRE